MPPNPLSGWRTSTLPNYIITYCWDFDANVQSQDDEKEDRKTTGGIESESEVWSNKEEETSSCGSTDLDHELRVIREEKTTGGTDPVSELQGNREEEKSGHPDCTDGNVELCGVENVEMEN